MLLWILLLRAARRGTVIHALAGILVLGLAAGAGSRAPPRLSLLDDAPGGAASPRWVRGLIRSAPIPTPDGGRVLVDVETLRIGGDWLQTEGRVEIRVTEWPPAANIAAGRQIEIFAALRRDRPLANPGDSRRDRLRDRGIDRRGALKSWQQVRLGPLRQNALARAARWRDELRDELRDRLRPSRHAGLLRALLLGERDDLPASFSRSMTTAGLVHLLAISGLHVGLLSGAGVALGRVAGLPPRMAAAAGMAVVALVAVIVEARSPVRRAATMAFALLGARALGGRVATTDGLAAAVFFLLVGTPAAAGQLAFQLSAVATFAIVAGIRPGKPRAAALVLTSCIAQAAVAPLLALHFRVLHPAGIVWNLVAVPLLSAALPLALLGTATGVPNGTVGALFGAAGACADAVLDVFMALVDAAEPWSPSVVVPSATWAGAAVCWTGLLLLLCPSRRARVPGLSMVAVAALLALRQPAPTASRLTVLDVGQGDAVIFSGPRGSLVYDAGGFPGIDFDVGHAVVLPQLRRLGAGSPGVVAMSHAHADHAAGLPSVIAATQPDEVWIGASPSDDWLTARILQSAAGAAANALSPTRYPRRTAGCDWSAVMPGIEILTAGARGVENAASLALEGRCDHVRILLAGDADARAERSWLTAGLGRSAEPTILKVGHHGSATSTTPALLHELRPDYAVISVGSTNPWGLPRDAVVQRLLGAGVAVYRTDRDGALTFSLGHRILIRGERWVLGTSPLGSY